MAEYYKRPLCLHSLDLNLIHRIKQLFEATMSSSSNPRGHSRGSSQGHSRGNTRGNPRGNPQGNPLANPPAASQKILTLDQELYLTSLALHVRGLTPWALYQFLRNKFPDGPFVSGPKVCSILSQLYHGGPQVRNGNILDRWESFQMQPLTDTAAQRLSLSTSELEAFLKGEISNEEVEICTFYNEGITPPTVWQQMLSCGLDTRHPNTNAWNDAAGITFNNRLRYQEEAQNYRGKINNWMAGSHLGKPHFIAYVALMVHGTTAFRIAEVVNAFFGTQRGTMTDIDVYLLVEGMNNHNKRYFSLLRDEGEVNLKNKEDRYMSGKCRNIYANALEELRLNINDPAYLAIQRNREETYRKDVDMLKEWDPKDYVKDLTVFEQMKDQGMLPFEWPTMEDKAAELRPLAQQMVMRKNLVSHFTCGLCKNEHGAAPCAR
ncbi:MAG: hypothetical protein Q9222_003069 [Ikaeria aurantiellina]